MRIGVNAGGWCRATIAVAVSASLLFTSCATGKPEPVALADIDTSTRSLPRFSCLTGLVVDEGFPRVVPDASLEKREADGIALVADRAEDSDAIIELMGKRVEVCGVVEIDLPCWEEKLTCVPVLREITLLRLRSIREIGA